MPRVPQAQVSVKQKRHGEHDSVTVTIAEGFRSASYDLPVLIRNDVRRSLPVMRNTCSPGIAAAGASSLAESKCRSVTLRTVILTRR